MNSLHRKLQFFSTGGGGKLKVVLPEENQLINADVSFNIEVRDKKSENLYLYFGNHLLTTIQFVNGIAQGTAIIPNEFLGCGTTYIIQDEQEIPIGDSSNITLTFTTESTSVNLNVIIKGNKDFNLGHVKGIIEKIDANLNPYNLGIAEGIIEKI